MKARKPGDPMRPRRVRTLSLDSVVTIQPEQWIGIANKKDFDAVSTRILRVFRHRDGGRWLVYGMRAKKADDKKHADKLAETNELVAAAELVEVAVQKVAAHCGLEALVADVLKQL